MGLKNICSKLIIMLFCLASSVAWADDVEFDTSYLGSNVYSGTHNVTIKGRTLTAGEWTGICLPFDAPKSVLDETFGENGYNVQEFSGIEGTTLSFRKVTEMKAGTPYIIKVTATVENPKFNNVTFALAIDDSWKTVTVADNIVFRGFYFDKYTYLLYDSNNANQYLWINSDASLSYNNEGVWVEKRPGTSAYFFCPNTSSSAQKPVISYEGGSEEGGGDEDNASLSYKIAHQLQITNLPTIYLTMDDVTDIDKDLYKDRGTNTAAYHQTAIKVVDKSGELTEFEEAADYLEVKVRGNSTASATKRPYRLKFAKKHKHDLLGYGYEKRNWTILANAYDDSKIRNAVTYKLGQMVGMPFCPGYKFVDLVINGDYRGLYQVSDHCEVDANRVNVDEDTGWFVEAARNDMAEEPKVYGSGMAISIKNPEYDVDALTDSLKAEVETCFNQTNWSNKFSDYSENGWRSVADENSLVNFYTAMQYTGDYDGFMVVKMYRNVGEKMQFGPLWDKDLAWGNYGGLDNQQMVEDRQQGYFAMATIKNSGSSTGAWYDPAFIKKVYKKMKALNDAKISTVLCNYADSLSALISESYALDSIRWHTSWGRIDQMDGTLREDSRERSLANFKTFVTEHASSILSTVKAQYDALGCASLPDEGEETEDKKTRKRQTDIPTIYIDGTLTQDGEWTDATTEIYDADVAVLGGTKTYAGIEAKYKGTFKAGDKHGYRLKFKKKAKLNGYRQWNLLPLDDDPTLIREALAFELGKQLGMHFTPSYQFVDVCTSASTDAEYSYAGTYLLVDRVKVEEGRARQADGDDDNDWLLELVDEVDSEDLAASVSESKTYPNIVVKNPDPDDYPGTENTLTEPVKAYAEAGFKNVESLAGTLNKEQFIKWYIAQEVLAAYNGFSDIYAYRSVTGSDQTLYFGPIWDNGRAFGNYKKDKKKQVLDMSDADDDTSFDGMMTEYAKYDLMRYLVRNLWLQEWFASGVQTKWTAVKDELLAALKSKTTSLASTVESSRKKNYSDAGWNLAALTNSYQASVDSIGTYLTERFDYLTKKFGALNSNRQLRYNVSNDNTLDAWRWSDGQTLDVQLKKRGTISADGWNSICLPFALSAQGVKDVFGAGTRVKRFSSVKDNGSSVGLYFTQVDGMKSGMPYIILPESDVAESGLLFKNVVFSVGEPQTVESPGGDYKFIGLLYKTKLTPTSDADHTIKYIGSGNQLFYLTKTASFNGARAYFKVSADSQAKPLTIIGDEPTGMTGMEILPDEPGDVYNLNGQKLNQRLEGLPHGIYIVNGKKVIK